IECVCPPQTSISLYVRPGSTLARISPASARPSAGSRNSSTNLIPPPARAPCPHARAASAPGARPRAGRSRRCAGGAPRPGTPQGPLRRPRCARSSWRRGPRRSPTARAPPRRPQPGGAGGRSLDRAPLQLSQLLLVGLAHLRQQRQRRERLALVDPREREAHVDEDPAAHELAAVAAHVEQPDVDGAPDPGDVDLGKLVGSV